MERGNKFLSHYPVISRGHGNRCYWHSRRKKGSPTRRRTHVRQLTRRRTRGRGGSATGNQKHDVRPTRRHLCKHARLNSYLAPYFHAIAKPEERSVVCPGVWWAFTSREARACTQNRRGSVGFFPSARTFHPVLPLSSQWLLIGRGDIKSRRAGDFSREQ